MLIVAKMCDFTSQKLLKKSSHLKIQKPTFPFVQRGYLIVQITIDQNPDLSSHFEKCVSSLLLQPNIH